MTTKPSHWRWTTVNAFTAAQELSFRPSKDGSNIDVMIGAAEGERASGDDSRILVPADDFFAALQSLFPERFTPTASQEPTEAICECGHPLSIHQPVEGGCQPPLWFRDGEYPYALGPCACSITQLDRIETALAALTAKMEESFEDDYVAPNPYAS